MSKDHDSTLATSCGRGGFPFALTKGPKESRYLTWLRNHSNYMATAGLMDYFRIGGVLIRGILINFLILLSWLLVVSLVVTHLYRRQLRSLDVEPAKVRDMLAVMVLEKRPVDHWLASQLNFDPEYQKALKAYGTTLEKKKGVELADIYTADDLRDPAALAAKLLAKKDGASQFVFDRLKRTTPAALQALQASPKAPDQLRQNLIDDINDIIKSEKIWDESWVQDLKMPRETKILYGDATFGELETAAQRKLNRLLLEAAYPRELGWARPLAVARWKLAAGSLVNAEANVMTELSSLINTKSVYKYEDFKGVRIRQEVQDEIDRLANGGQRTDSTLRRLNWLLLEDAYPELPRNSAPSQPNGFQAFWAWVNSPLMPDPFFLTSFVVMLSVVCIMASPVRVVIGQIAGAKKSRERAGGDSSVQIRDRFERWFGRALLLVLVTALFEALPVLVDQFHRFRINPKMDANAIFAVLSTAVVAAMGRAGAVLKFLGGAKQKVATWLIGLLGLVVPLLVILYVTEFLVYQNTVGGDAFRVAIIFFFAFGVVALWALVTGLKNNSFEGREIWKLGALVVGFIIAGVCVAVYFGPLQRGDHVSRIWNYGFFAVCAVDLWVFCRLVVDVNLTSVHSLYRDRLASAYLMGLNSQGEVDIEEDILLEEICSHEAGSTAPYHLINAALNLQGSKDMSIRDRDSDFFIFSKRFIGGNRTGYCRTTAMEQVHPSMKLATAMAISAAAASPNMGQSTNPATVAFMVLLNIRLGYWLPNPGLLEEMLAGDSLQEAKEQRTNGTPGTARGFAFAEVFEQELVEIQKRWDQVYRNKNQRRERQLHKQAGKLTTRPTTEHGLVGVAFSGGGIRSATINLGIAQALHEHGIFDHVDYMSTVSGGGYLGSSLSTLMRARPFSDIEGTVTITEDPKTRDQIVRVQGKGTPPKVQQCRYSSFAKLEQEVFDGAEVKAGQRLIQPLGDKFHSEIDGEVSIRPDVRGGQIVTVHGEGQAIEYHFSKFDVLAVKPGDRVVKKQALVERYNSLSDRFRWRVPPSALLNEMLMKLDETHKWVNLSDGGHIENLAVIELLRRRCQFIIIGDGEADPDLAFNGLATLIRYARIDLGIQIDLNPDQIRMNRQPQATEEAISNTGTEHWAFGTITYPPDDENGLREEEGYLIYLKSSYTGDEDEMIKEYRHSHPEFPHESTADQFFHENQFECYRALGQHIAEGAIAEMSLVGAHDGARKTFKAFSGELSTVASTIAKVAKLQQQEADQKKMDRWKKATVSVKDQVPSSENEKAKRKKR